MKNERLSRPLDQAIVRQLLDRAEYIKASHRDGKGSRFTTAWILRKLNGPQLAKMQGLFRQLDTIEADLLDWIHICLQVLQVDEHEKLYLVMGAIEFFQRLCETYGLEKTITFKVLTDFVIEVNSA